MTIIQRKFLPAVLVAATVCFVGAGLATAKYVHGKTASSESASASASLTVPAETPIRVRLDQSLDSAENHSGDVFDGHVAEPVVVDNRVVIPESTPVRGRVVEARRSGHLSHPGHLEVALTEMQLDGQWQPVSTRETGRKGGSHKNRNIAWIGGSGAGGALIGAIAAGGKGALIGGPIGAGAGTAVAFMTGKKDVHLPAESQIVFHLSEPLSVPPQS